MASPSFCILPWDRCLCVQSLGMAALDNYIETVNTHSHTISKRLIIMPCLRNHLERLGEVESKGCALKRIRKSRIRCFTAWLSSDEMRWWGMTRWKGFCFVVVTVSCFIHTLFSSFYLFFSSASSLSDPSETPIFSLFSQLVKGQAVLYSLYLCVQSDCSMGVCGGEQYCSDNNSEDSLKGWKEKRALYISFWWSAFQ